MYVHYDVESRGSVGVNINLFCYVTDAFVIIAAYCLEMISSTLFKIMSRQESVGLFPIFVT